MPIKLKNNASDFLAQAVTDTDTSVVLQSGDTFPELASGEFFYATIQDVAGQLEIVKVTGKFGSTFNIERGQEGTGTASFPAGSRFELRVTVASIEGGTYTPDGTGAEERTIQEKLQEVVSINDFSGADPTGATSSSSAIAAALAAADTVVFEPGTYLIDQNLELLSNKRLLGKPGAVIYRNSNVRVIGITPSLTPLTAAANFNYGSTILTLDASSYNQVSVGDYLYLQDRTPSNSDFILDFVSASNADLQSPGEWIYQTQVFKIIDKLASNVVRVDAAAHVDFDFSTTASISLVDGDVIENVQIKGLTFENGPALAGSSAENAFINARYVYDVTVEDCTFNLKGHTGGIFVNFGQWNIRNNQFNESRVLAVFLRQAVPDSVISGNVFRNQMSGDSSIFIEAHNYNITISNNQFDGARSQELTDASQLISAVQMDAKVNNVSIVGNNVSGYGVGFRLELGCMFNVITGNTVQNCDISGIRLNQSSQNIISGNSFYNCGNANSAGILADARSTFFVRSGSDRNIISGNVVSYDSNRSRTVLTLSGDKNQFINNTIINGGASVVSGESNRLAGNKFQDARTSQQIINILGGGSHYNVIEDNEFVSAITCDSAIRLADGAECNTVRRNISDGCSFTVSLTTTSKAQSLYENTRYSASNTNTTNVYNTAISAPVMPSNAVMPRRFRIYSTTIAATSSLSPQGDTWWEYTQEITGTQYFQKFEVTTTQVSI